MLKLIMFGTIVYLAYKLYKINRALAVSQTCAIAMQAILIKYAGPVKAADHLVYAFDHDVNPYQKTIWQNLRKKYGVTRGDWYDGGDVVRRRMAEEFAEQKVSIDKLYHLWKQNDLRDKYDSE